jgi:hypothetical protein
MARRAASCRQLAWAKQPVKQFANVGVRNSALYSGDAIGAVGSGTVCGVGRGFPARESARVPSPQGAGGIEPEEPFGGRTEEGPTHWADARDRSDG